jgi:hypothetical protein
VATTLARARRQHGGQAEAGADLEHALAGARVQVTAEQKRAGLGRLHALRHAEHAAGIGVEQDAVVHYLPCTFLK